MKFYLCVGINIISISRSFVFGHVMVLRVIWNPWLNYSIVTRTRLFYRKLLVIHLGIYLNNKIWNHSLILHNISSVNFRRSRQYYNSIVANYKYNLYNYWYPINISYIKYIQYIHIELINALNVSVGCRYIKLDHLISIYNFKLPVVRCKTFLIKNTF